MSPTWAFLMHLPTQAAEWDLSMVGMGATPACPDLLDPDLDLDLMLGGLQGQGGLGLLLPEDQVAAGLLLPEDGSWAAGGMGQAVLDPHPDPELHPEPFPDLQMGEVVSGQGDGQSGSSSSTFREVRNMFAKVSLSTSAEDELSFIKRSLEGGAAMCLD